MAKGAKRQKTQVLNTRGILILVLVSLLVVPLVYWIIGWKAGFVLLLLIPWIAYWRFIPSKLFRIFLYAYLIYAVAFTSAIWLQMQLAQNPRVIAFVEDHALISFFLGGEHGFAKQVLFSIVAGIFLGFLAINIPLWTLMFVSSEWVLALHQIGGVDRRSAIGYVRSLILGMQYPWMIVDEGKVIQSKPGGVLPEIGGPGMAVIRPGHAVIFERGGKITQVAAPGLVRLERHERIQEIVELKPMWSGQVLENVLTKDRIPLRITFGVSFQIEPKTEADKRPGSHVPGGVALTSTLTDDIYTVYEGSVRKAVFDTAADWKATTFAVGDSMLRDIVATYDFDQIFKRQPLPGAKDDEVTFHPSERTIHEIENKILNGHRKAAPTWGVYTKSVDIKIIELPEEAQEQMLDWWRASWRRRMDLAQAESQKEAAITRGKGEAEALDAREQVRAQNQTRMIAAIFGGLSQMSAEEREALLGLRFLEALEKIASDPATKILLPAQFGRGSFDFAGLLQEPHGGPGPGNQPPPELPAGDGQSGPADGLDPDSGSS